MPSDATYLSQTLEDTKYASVLEQIRQHAEPVLKNINRRYPTFTLHDWDHARMVERNLTELVLERRATPAGGQPSALPAPIRFLLVAAAWLHDIGMAGPGPAGETEEEARAKHHIRSREYIHDKREELGLVPNRGLDPGVATMIGRICQNHGEDGLPPRRLGDMFDGEPVDMPFLCACLRLADILDVSGRRAPRLIYAMIQDKIPAHDDHHWTAHLTIQLPTRNDNSLILSAPHKSVLGLRAIESIKQKLDKELARCRPALEDAGWAVPAEIIWEPAEADFVEYECSFAKQPNIRRLLDLTIHRMYSRRDVAIRELVQNCLDACSIRRLHPHAPRDYSGRIEVFQIDTEDGDERLLLVRDDGMGMSAAQLAECFTVIGASLTDAEDIRALLRDHHKPRLIASFGIGVLSCFSIASKMVIRTHTPEMKAVELVVADPEEKTRPSFLREKSDYGTEILLHLNDDGRAIDFGKSLRHHVRRCAVPIWFRESTVKEVSDVWGLRSDQAAPLDLNPWPSSQDHLLELDAEGIDGRLWLTGQRDGRLMVLQEGILVREEYPGLLGPLAPYVSGVVDLPVGRVNLTTSRAEIDDDDACARLRKDLQDAAWRLLDDCVGLDSDTDGVYGNDETELTPLGQRYFELAHSEDPAVREPMLDILASHLRFPVFEGDGPRFSRLCDLYPEGGGALSHVKPRDRYVEEAGVFDGERIYRDYEDIVFGHAVAHLLVAGGERVVERRSYEWGGRPYSTRGVIERFAEKAGLVPKDVNHLTEDELDRYFVPRPPSDALRKLLPENTRLVDAPEIPKLAVRFRGGYLLNLAHRRARRVEEDAERLASNPSARILIRVLFNLAAHQFEEAAADIDAVLTASEDTGREMDARLSARLLRIVEESGLLEHAGELRALGVREDVIALSEETTRALRDRLEAARRKTRELEDLERELRAGEGAAERLMRDLQRVREVCTAELERYAGVSASELVPGDLPALFDRVARLGAAAATVAERRAELGEEALAVWHGTPLEGLEELAGRYGKIVEVARLADSVEERGAAHLLALTEAELQVRLRKLRLALQVFEQRSGLRDAVSDGDGPSDEKEYEGLLGDLLGRTADVPNRALAEVIDLLGSMEADGHGRP